MTQPNYDRLDELATEGAKITLSADYLARVMERPDDAEPGPPPDPGPGEPRMILDETIEDLSKQTTFPVELPESFQVSWDFTDSPPAEPPKSTHRIALTVLDLHSGGKWAGRQRLAVTAIRRPQGEQKKWDLLVGYGTGKKGGGTNWGPKGFVSMLWDDILEGAIVVEGSKLLLMLPDDDGALADSTLISVELPSLGDLRLLQVGHEDADPAESGKGDEPWPGGSGRIGVWDHTSGEKDDTLDLVPPDIADEVLAVLPVLRVSDPLVRRQGGGASGDVGTGVAGWVRGFRFDRFAARSWSYTGRPYFGMSDDERGQLAEQYISGGPLDTAANLKWIASLQIPRTFTEKDVDEHYGGARRGVRPPWGSPYVWPEVEGGSDRERQDREEAKALVSVALLDAEPKYDVLAGAPMLDFILEDLLT